MNEEAVAQTLMEAIVISVPLYLTLIALAGDDIREELDADSGRWDEFGVVFVHGGTISVSFLILLLGFFMAAAVATGRSDDFVTLILLIGAFLFLVGFQGIMVITNHLQRERRYVALGVFILSMIVTTYFLTLILGAF